MARYAYKVRDQQNRLLTGIMEGTGVNEIVDTLNEKNLSTISIEELNFDGSSKNKLLTEKLLEGMDFFREKVPFKSIVFFTRQFATMLEGGVPIARALSQLAKTEKPLFKKIITTVADDIGMGFTLSDAISRHPACFNSMYVSVVRSGEITGSLNRVLEQLADHLENVEAMKSKVKTAMRYPLFVGGFVLLMVIGILWKLVPVFEKIYGNFGGSLPVPTQILISASHAIQNNFLLFIAGLIALFILFKFLLTNDRFKLKLDSLVLKVPVFGMIIRKNILALFCRTMALLMESGTPILQATEIAAGVVSNKLYAQALHDVYHNLRKGELLSSALEKTGKFPPLIVQLVCTGEESGKVDDLLCKAAFFYEREIRNTVDSLASIIEPFMIIILGAIVGAILIALYMPVFMLGKLVK
ncbi:MAG: type II secretion system F family protein [Chitinivibrionales bacterium]|nr:type II secretion system F family protein [Chitinivibrionales bacterium]